MARFWREVAVVAGVGLAVAGCGGEPKTVSSANSQFKPESGDDAPQALAGDATAEGAVNPSPETGAKKPVKKPVPVSVDKLDADSLPDGPPEKIVAFMRQLEGFEPRGVSNAARRADLMRFLRLIIEAGDRVLADEDTEPKLRLEAAKIKMSAVMALAQRGEPKADELLTAYCQRLSKDKEPNISRFGRTMLFSIALAKFQNGEGDEQAITDEFAQLLALPGEDPENITFLLGAGWASTLEQKGNNEAALAIVGLLRKHYKNSKDEQVQEQLAVLGRRTRMIELDVNGKVMALFDAQPDPKAAGILVQTMKQFLAVEQPGRFELKVAEEAADHLERTQHYKESRQIIDMITTTFTASTDPEVAKTLKKVVDSAKKRLGLVGKPLVIAGQTLDGQPFDTSSLKGKIVLVDFWATWCGPCLEEIPNIAHYYEKYKDKGFEVIGYNLDDKPQQLERFFANQQLPWLTIVSDNPDKPGFSSPVAEACGVRTIPFLILLDGQGKVIALHTRQEKLGEVLAELLGPVEETPVPEVEK
jgi:thiol-disulfide isomerase/thioredoxin